RSSSLLLPPPVSRSGWPPPRSWGSGNPPRGPAPTLSVRQVRGPVFREEVVSSGFLQVRGCAKRAAIAVRVLSVESPRSEFGPKKAPRFPPVVARGTQGGRSVDFSPRPVKDRSRARFRCAAADGRRLAQD